MRRADFLRTVVLAPIAALFGRGTEPRMPRDPLTGKWIGWDMAAGEDAAAVVAMAPDGLEVIAWYDLSMAGRVYPIPVVRSCTPDDYVYRAERQ